jgi:hypothetical protein
MQKTSTYLAKNKVVVVADLAGFVTEYRPVYQKNLNVYRGIDNMLYFEVKNHDQKPVSLAGYSPVFLAFDEDDNLVLEKRVPDVDRLDDVITRTTVVAESVPDVYLEFSSTADIEVGQTVSGTYIKANTLVTAVTDNVVTINKTPSDSIPLGTEISFQSREKRGVFTVTINENDLLNVKQQYLKYTIYLVDSIGGRTLTYSDDHFGVQGIIYVSGNALPGPVPTGSITNFTQDSQNPTAWYSDTLDAQPAINGNSALHTAVIYTNSYNGNVTVQGTLEPSLTLNTFWADIVTLNFDGTETEPVPVNFNGVYSYLRFKTDASPADTITKVLVRN